MPVPKRAAPDNTEEPTQVDRLLAHTCYRPARYSHSMVPGGLLVMS